MRLVRICSIVLGLLAFSACADIIPLTGGVKDEVSPKPEEINPPMGATNVSPTQITLEFDEYITLKDPANTVSMIPEVGTLTTTQDKKKVTVSWSGTLKPETTYILNLNGTVRDLNEGNDSIIQMVFSTGTFIDSLSHKGSITSAYSGEYIQNATVCLFHKDSLPYINQPTYFTRSNNKGEYAFSYLKNEEYRLFAFQDADKNAKVSKTENIAFTETLIRTVDTLPTSLRLFKTKNTNNKLSIVIEKPGTAILSGINFDSTEVKLLGEPITIMNRYRTDSLRVSLPNRTEKSLRFTTFTDTLLRTIEPEDRLGLFGVQLKSNKLWKSGDTVKFSANEFVRSIDTTNLKIVNSYGKSITYKALIQDGSLNLVPLTTENFTVVFNKNAVLGEKNSNDTTRYSFETFTKERCGELTLDVSEFEDNWVFEIINNANTEKGEVVAKSSLTGSKLVFTELIPGDYSVRCFKDDNHNSKWDSGDYDKKLQPEIILRFPVKQKIRANWTIEEKLSPK